MEKNCKKGYRVHDVNIVDIAPTLLYLLGVSIPVEMDGKILKDIFESDFLKSNSISYTKAEDIRNSETEGLTQRS